jgi:Leucine-rich repeat (LRR) protein
LFSGYPKLTSLDVGRCHPNEQAIKSIAKCTNLTDLDISGNRTVNDRNIKYLTALKQLTSLRLFGTSVSLNGLAQLKDLPLRQIVLPQRDYEPAQLDALRKVFPQAKLIAKERGKLKGNDEAIFAPLH